MFPLVFCTGMLRSGSTWSFNVCRFMARVTGARTRRPVCSEFMNPDITDEFLRTHPLPLPGPTVIKAHALGPYAMTLLHGGQARSICTFRDPRDCVVSMMTFVDEPFEISHQRIRSALILLDSMAQSGNTLLVRYEDMMADPLAQVRAIAAFLQSPLEEGILRRIDLLAGMENSRKICQSLKSKPDDQIRHALNHRVDPETVLHENHIQSGKEGRWKEELTPEQIRLLEDDFRPWLERLKYAPAGAAI